ncbi:SusC/RagA family TonB-linked outer membrane protein [Chitinophaga sp. SYP-B3965]|uniref:SusC/RagA family TonB-linked outer membrane protein n=1 Tax=Chitinophaga sp. SYP-B3965 TaxID=2663120 RepID=UPI001563B511|nr:SusC/RagA family TonB-linked outer membrane protein [Chitinophaga sp. SYP-B3965]
MKLTAVLLTIGLVNVYAASSAQSITLSGKNIPLKKVFDAIEKQTEYVVFSKKNDLQNTTALTISVKDMPLAEFLRMALKDQPVNFSIEDKTIFLFKKPVITEQPATPVADTTQPLRSIIGIVTDEEGKPLQFVSVAVDSRRGARAGAVTLSDGSFFIRDVLSDETLIISMIGYKTKEVKTRNWKVPAIRLEKSVSQLKDVVISNGMYTRKVESFTGAVSTYTGEQLKSVGNKNILESLKTLDPSFIMVENNTLGSNPNALPNIEVRGKTSISTTGLNDQFAANPNQPLFVLDGFESSLQAIYDLDMNRVASIYILKDAASTAIYGSKAANGVVVVETKRPVAGELRVSYTADVSFDIPDLTSYNLMNSSEKIQFEKLSGVYESQPNFQYEWTQKYYERLASVASGINTYWINEPVRLGVANRHSLQLSGGNRDLQFAAGVSYRNQDGVMKGSGRQSFGGNFMLAYRKGIVNITNIMSVDGNKGEESPYGSFTAFSQANPYYKKTRPDGSVGKYLDSSSISNIYVYNPLFDAGLYSINETKGFSFSNNLQAIITLSKKFRLQGGLLLSRGTNNSVRFIPPDNSSFDKTTDTRLKGTYNSRQADNTNYNGNIMVTYGEAIGKSQLNANARADISQSISRTTGFGATGFPSGSNGNPAYSYSYTPFGRPASSAVTPRSVGFVGSINYTYDNRFLLDATYRLSGSSVFGSNKLFRPFFSAGIGWNLHNEPFFQQISWISLLKIRGNIGITGNENLGQFTSVSTYTYVPGLNNFGQGLALTSLGNPDLEWQETVQQSYGLDFSLFRNRVNGNVGYYIKKTDPLVITATGAVPSSTGANDNYMLNAGNLVTKGWDFTLRTSPIYNLRDRIIWNVGIMGNAYTAIYGGFNNKLQALNKDQLDNKGLVRYTDGYSPDDMWAVVSRGIDPATGQEIFQKKDGTLTFVYNTDDIIKVGNSRPVIEGVVNTSFTYKSFTFGANVRYRIGGSVFNNALYSRVENISLQNLVYNQDKRALYERWKKPGDVSQYKSILLSSTTPISSRFVQKDSHLVGESFSLNWRIYSGWIRKLKLQGLNCSLYMNDIFRLESVQTERGLDYPFARTASFSINASF